MTKTSPPEGYLFTSARTFIKGIWIKWKGLSCPGKLDKSARSDLWNRDFRMGSILRHPRAVIVS